MWNCRRNPARRPALQDDLIEQRVVAPGHGDIAEEVEGIGGCAGFRLDVGAPCVEVLGRDDDGRKNRRIVGVCVHGVTGRHDDEWPRGAGGGCHD